MYEGNPVDLRMEKIISADGIFDEATRQCRDAKYRCYISTRTELLYCTGVVKERYCRDDRKFLKLRIENGFYNVYEGRKMTKRA